MSDPLQEFVDAFSLLVSAVGELRVEPGALMMDLPVDERTLLARRFLAFENRLGEVHRQVDRQEIRLDAQLGRILELEVEMRRLDAQLGRILELGVDGASQAARGLD